MALVQAHAENRKIDISGDNTDKSYTSYNTAVSLPKGETLVVMMARYCYFNSKITGGGTLNLYAGGDRCFLGNSDKKWNDWGSFTGDVHIWPFAENSAKAGFYGVVLAHGGKASSPENALDDVKGGKLNPSMATNRVTLHEGATMCGEANSNGSGFRIGELHTEAGSTLQGWYKKGRSVYYLLGGLNTDATLAGTIKPVDYDDATGSFSTEDLEICIVNEDGGVFSYNVGYAYERFTDTLVVAPEGIVFNPYSLRYDNAYKYYVPEMVYIARDGNDFYFKGMSTKTPEALVKGELVGDSIYIAGGQYVGLYDGQYYLYTKGATYMGLDESGYPIYRSKDYCVMYYNEAEDSFYGPDGFLICLGKARNASYSQSFPTQDIKRFYEVAATPATPDIRGFEVDMTYNLMTSMTYVVPSEDVDGNYINPDSLYYRFFVNGEVFVFDKDWYPMFVDSVLVNSKFSDRGQTSRQRTDCNGSYHVIAFDHDLSLSFDSIALQSIYFMAGEERYSDYCVYVVADGSKHTLPSGQTGIAAISEDNRQATAVKYFDLSGRQIAEPGKGIYIKQTSFKDGTVQHETIFR